jgi:paraquat-inducible protein B
MSDDGERPPSARPPSELPPSARLRPRRWLTWVWIVPAAAAAVVLWLVIRTLIDRGPLITISFTEAEGLQTGETKVEHKNVELGTVESVYLNRDMSRVFVQARMRRSVTAHLTADARFWIVRPRFGFSGVSGLSTLVSGSYIEMEPGAGTGKPQRSFVGLDEPPVLQPDTPGRMFRLHAADLGSLVGGSPISYRGVPVGEVQGFALDQSRRQIEIYAFIRAPYQELVHPQSRFWNSGGVDVSIGSQGVRFRASSWQQLLSGGVSFDTPDDALARAASAAGSTFRLYANETDAERDPRGRTLVYRAEFTGGVGNIGPGTEVQLQGAGIGEVTDARLQYDDASQSLRTQVTIELDPSRIEIAHRHPDSTADPADAVSARLRALVARGLRAQLTTANFLTGLKVVSLEMVNDAPRARIELVDGYAQLPTSSAADIADILAGVKDVVHHIDTATAGPALGHAIQELDRTLTHLDQLTADMQPQVKPLLASLREAAEAAQRTLQAANGMLGDRAASGTDLPRLMRELTDAARSLRALADYLDRHPEALIRGRKPESP